MFPMSIMIRHMTNEITDNSGIRSLFTTNPTPSARSYFGYSYDVSTNTVYIYGGSTNTSNYDSTFWSFDCGTKVWKQLASGPIITYGSALCVYNGTIYLLGGMSSTGVLNTFYEYNISTNTWTQNTTSTGLAVTRVGTFMVQAGGKLYLWGGTSTVSLHEYNIGTNTWSALSSSTAVQNAITDMCTDGTYLYCIGSSTAQKYNIGTGQWSSMSTYGPNNNGGRTIYNPYDSKIYGVTYTTMNMYRYDTELNTWTMLSTNATLNRPVGVLVPNKGAAQIYHLLGYTGATRVNEQYIYR